MRWTGVSHAVHLSADHRILGRHRGKVAARAEGATHAGEDHHPAAGVRGRLLQHTGELLAHGHVDRVAALGIAQLDVPATVLHLHDHCTLFGGR